MGVMGIMDRLSFAKNDTDDGVTISSSSSSVLELLSTFESLPSDLPPDSSVSQPALASRGARRPRLQRLLDSPLILGLLMLATLVALGFLVALVVRRVRRAMYETEELQGSREMGGVGGAGMRGSIRRRRRRRWVERIRSAWRAMTTRQGSRRCRGVAINNVRATGTTT